MPNYPSISGGVETPTVTPTQIVSSLEISKTGQVVDATIGVRPTTYAFSTIASDFPKAIHGVRTLGINSGGGMIKSWMSVNTDGIARVYCDNNDVNSLLLFSVTYITSE